MGHISLASCLVSRKSIQYFPRDLTPDARTDERINAGMDRADSKIQLQLHYNYFYVLWIGAKFILVKFPIPDFWGEGDRFPNSRLFLP